MTQIIDGNFAGGNRFDHVEAVLRRYPEIEKHELADLKHWFGKEASAFEVASLASKDHLKAPYAQFKTEHLDRLGMREIAFTVLVAASVLGLIAYVLMQG